MGIWSFILALIGIVFLGFEGIRFQELNVQCSRLQTQNAILLQDVACADPWERTLRGAKQEALCAAAKEENARTSLACAWQRMWTQGELYQFWERVSTSYWLLFGLGAPALCTAVMMWFSNRNQAAARRDQREMFESLAKSLRTISQHPEEEVYHKKRKSPRMITTAQPTWQFEQQRQQNYVQLVNV